MVLKIVQQICRLTLCVIILTMAALKGIQFALLGLAWLIALPLDKAPEVKEKIAQKQQKPISAPETATKSAVATTVPLRLVPLKVPMRASLYFNNLG